MTRSEFVVTEPGHMMFFLLLFLQCHCVFISPWLLHDWYLEYIKLWSSMALFPPLRPVTSEIFNFLKSKSAPCAPEILLNRVIQDILCEPRGWDSYCLHHVQAVQRRVGGQ